MIGTWYQGTNHSLTFSTNGGFTSIFKGYPDGRTDTWQGKWSVHWGRLVMTDVRSNSAIVPDSRDRILGLGAHFLDLRSSGYKISLTR